ncbi:MAG: hypothetical protein ABW005_11745, partial [Burkholderiaceae bacterium]
MMDFHGDHRPLLVAGHGRRDVCVDYCARIGAAAATDSGDSGGGHAAPPARRSPPRRGRADAVASRPYLLNCSFSARPAAR